MRGFPTPPPNNVAGPSSIWARAREAASRSHRAVSRSGRRGAGPLSNRTESPPTVPTPTMAHKYARSRRGPATCSQQPTVPSDPSGGAALPRVLIVRPSSSPGPREMRWGAAAAAVSAAATAAACPSTTVRSRPPAVSPSVPVGFFRSLTSHHMPAGTAGVPASEGGGRRRKEAAERRRGGGGREVRAAIRRPALHGDPRHGAPLTEGRTRQHCGGCDLWSRSPAGAFGSSSLYPADVAAAVHHVLVVG